MEKKKTEELSKYYIQKRKLEGRRILMAYRTTEEKNQNLSHLKSSKNKRSHSKAIYKLLDGYYNTFREEKIQRYLLKKQNDVLVYYEEDEVFSSQ